MSFLSEHWYVSGSFRWTTFGAFSILYSTVNLGWYWCWATIIERSVHDEVFHLQLEFTLAMPGRSQGCDINLDFTHSVEILSLMEGCQRLYCEWRPWRWMPWPCLRMRGYGHGHGYRSDRDTMATAPFWSMPYFAHPTSGLRMSRRQDSGDRAWSVWAGVLLHPRLSVVR